jgi:hypothetical protein
MLDVLGRPANCADEKVAVGVCPHGALSSRTADPSSPGAISNGPVGASRPSRPAPQRSRSVRIGADLSPDATEPASQVRPRTSRARHKPW